MRTRAVPGVAPVSRGGGVGSQVTEGPRARRRGCGGGARVTRMQRAEDGTTGQPALLGDRVKIKKLLECSGGGGLGTLPRAWRAGQTPRHAAQARPEQMQSRTRRPASARARSPRSSAALAGEVESGTLGRRGKQRGWGRGCRLLSGICVVGGTFWSSFSPINRDKNKRRAGRAHGWGASVPEGRASRVVWD